MWAWLTDRLVLRPSRNRIPCESEPRWIEWKGGRFECYVHQTPDGREPTLWVLKFPGTGGRAERSSLHPADAWAPESAEVWTVNPPGYGASPGRARLQSVTAVAEAAWAAVHALAKDRPVVVSGNSLGTLSAIYLAAHFPVCGLLVRNPVPLRELILFRHGRWVSVIARQVPDALCPIRNAARASAPALFVSSGSDRVVPPQLQQRVIEAYAGPKQLMWLPNADHADPPAEAEMPEYTKHLLWLREML